MKILFSTVTPCSKALAAVLFVTCVAAAFYFGIQYGQLRASADKNPAPHFVPAPLPEDSPVSTWRTFTDAAKKFTLQYPFYLEEIYPPQSPDILLSLKIDRFFEMGTNFSEATITVTASKDTTKVKDCFAPQYEGQPSESATINGTVFTVFNMRDAGLGNYYTTHSYRAVRDNTCYILETTIHSTNISNWPEEYGIKLFNEVRVSNFLQKIISTFRFL